MGGDQPKSDITQSTKGRVISAFCTNNLINKNLAAEEKGKGTEQNCYSSLIKHFTLLLSIYPEGMHESKREEINFLHKHA